MKISSICCALLAMSLNVFAAEAPHPIQLGSVVGTGIDLKMHDHAVAGAIRDFVVFGYVDEESFSAELTLRKEGQLIRTVFKKDEAGKIGGTISIKRGETSVSQTFVFEKTDPKNMQIFFDLNGIKAVATFTPESIANNHLINPAVEVQFSNGEKLNYKMQGEGCYGYLMFNTMMIAGSYLL